jgi:lactate dehydrogenase-like 2-hydroxyacid dehydrogenase
MACSFQFVRDHRAGYWQSLSTLERAKKVKPGLYTKTSLMLGLGETEKEVIQTMKALSNDWSTYTIIKPRATIPEHVMIELRNMNRGERQVTKGIPAYIRDAAHTPAMKEYLIPRSKEATGREKSWDDTTYELIDWRHYGESFKNQLHGRRIQLSKYTNDLLHTKRRLATFDNRVDG